jgi:hypothetical protein
MNQANLIFIPALPKAIPYPRRHDKNLVINTNAKYVNMRFGSVKPTKYQARPNEQMEDIKNQIKLYTKMCNESKKFLHEFKKVLFG